MTVSEMAEQIAAATPGVPPATVARQIRNWAQSALFGVLELRGNGPTAAQVFCDQHLVAARIFSILTRLGMTTNHLETVARLLRNAPMTDYPVGKAYKQGLPFVLEKFQDGQQDWRLMIYTDAAGVIKAGGFVRDGQLNAMAETVGPVVISIGFSAICDGLFPVKAEA